MLGDLDAVIDAERVRRVVLIGLLPLGDAGPRVGGAPPGAGGRARPVRRFRARLGPHERAGTQALLSLIDRDWDTFVESAAHAWLGWPDPELGRQTAEWFRTATTPAIAKATMREASAIDVTPELRSVACPVLVLHRAEATVIPLELSRDLVASLPDARLELLPGTSASLFFEDPEGVADRIAAFAAEPTTAPPGRSKRAGIAAAAGAGDRAGGRRACQRASSRSSR